MVLDRARRESALLNLRFAQILMVQFPENQVYLTLFSDTESIFLKQVILSLIVLLFLEISLFPLKNFFSCNSDTD